MTLQLLALVSIGVAFAATAFAVADFIFDHMKRRGVVKRRMREIGDY